MYSFYSHGKLLISGEYAILDGALGLALPTKKGQWLHVYPEKKGGVYWQSFDKNGDVWFETVLFQENKPKSPIVQTLERILSVADRLNPDFQIKNQNIRVETHLEFDRDWGLGSSSTLINNIAQWAEVDAYQLLFKSFGGSGYDIACAKTPYAILYRLENGNPVAYPADFSPLFSDKIYFIYLNQKQDSKEGIKLYKNIKKSKKQLITDITNITENLIRTNSFNDFENLVYEHEKLISKILCIPPVKERLFSDFKGSIKSLGAWGGDFVMATGGCEYVMSYFKEKGFDTIIPFREMMIS